MTSRLRSSSAPPRPSAPQRAPPKRAPPKRPVALDLPSSDEEVEGIGPPPLISPPQDDREPTSDDELLPPPAEGPPIFLISQRERPLSVSPHSPRVTRQPLVVQPAAKVETPVPLTTSSAWRAEEDRQAGTLVLLHSASRLGVELCKDSSGWFSFQDVDGRQFLCQFTADTRMAPWRSRHPVALPEIPDRFGPFNLKLRGSTIVVSQPVNSRDVGWVDSAMYLSPTSITFRDKILAAVRSPQREPALPEGWSAAVDPNSSHTYYFNNATEEVSWLHPVTGLPHTPVGSRTLDFSMGSSGSDVEGSDVEQGGCSCGPHHAFGCKFSPFYREPLQKQGILTRVDARIRKRVNVSLEGFWLHYGGKTPLTLTGAAIEPGKDKFSVTNGTKTVTFKPSCRQDKDEWVSAISNNIYAATHAEDNPTPVTRPSRLRLLRKRSSSAANVRSSSVGGRTHTRHDSSSYL